jgi:hypothetical protein
MILFWHACVQVVRVLMIQDADSSGIVFRPRENNVVLCRIFGFDLEQTTTLVASIPC